MIIRTTILEKFRRFIENVSEYDTEDCLIETLTGVFTGNEYTRIGKAFHLLIECGDIRKSALDAFSIPTGPKYVEMDGFNVLFSESQVKLALVYKDEIKGCFHEIRTTKDYFVKGEKVTLTGCADVILGNSIRDIKTKYSYMKSITDYSDSVQWKVYCDLFEVPEFFFDVFEFTGYDKEKNGYDVSGLLMKRHEPIHCLAYNTMQQDINYLLSEFVEYVKFRKLESYFVKPV